MRNHSVFLFFGVFGRDDGVDIAAHVEIPHDFHIPRVKKLHQIVQNKIGHVLVEDLPVAETIHVQFKRFKLHAFLVGYIFDPDCGEIGKTRPGANAGEFGTGELDRVPAYQSAIIERFKLIILNCGLAVHFFCRHSGHL